MPVNMQETLTRIVVEGAGQDFLTGCALVAIDNTYKRVPFEPILSRGLFP